jgi:integrase
MPAQIPHLPKYRHYKPKDLAVVRIDGRDFYLGKYGSEESKQRYRRLLAERLASPAPAPPAQAAQDRQPGLSVSELIVAYWDRHVATYYIKHGRPTSERDNIRQALRFLRRLYGHTPALDFGPLALKAVRESMIEAGRCRSLINKDVNRVKGLFRWAVEHELVPASVYEALRAVAGLREGRSEAKEARPIGPVAIEVIEATIRHLSPQVAAMVRFQLLTGARPGEVACLRPRDLTSREGEVWEYRPREHKTEHFDRERVVLIGRQAQAVLKPWLQRDPNSYAFCPADVVALRGPGRTAPVTASRTGRPAARPKPGGRYTKDSYRVAIQRACRRAGVPVWTPLQLRHTAATLIRSRYGLEAAQAVLGHAKADVTQIYAERDRARACAVMAEIG